MSASDDNMNNGGNFIIFLQFIMEAGELSWMEYLESGCTDERSKQNRYLTVISECIDTCLVLVC
jgi:hypothetical protein